MPLLMLRERASDTDEVAGELSLPFELRRKSRLLTRLTDGKAVGLMLERGAPLRDGECLRGDDGRVYRIRAADEAVMDARCSDATALARVAYHLGNRHALLEIGDSFVRFAADDVLASMARGLGATITSLRGPFEPEAGAYAIGTHTHGADGRHAPVIHDRHHRVPGK
jgi:urease accessory protein